MEWMTYPESKPKESGTYHVSICRPYINGDLTFHYVAYYDVKTSRWFKNDGFDDDSVKEVIKERIVGWVDGLGIHI